LNDFVKTFILMSYMNAEFEPLFKLSRAERLQLVEDLWDSLAQEDTELSVSEEKRAELRRRKERFFTASVIRSHMGAGEAAGTDAA
jgi:putative addiction module component